MALLLISRYEIRFNIIYNRFFIWLRQFATWTGTEMATELFVNSQRTSTSSGILKSEAVLQFLKVLEKHHVERFADIEKVFNNDDFENEIRAIKGQASGISLKYFYMLAGKEDLIKPDRMIIGFLKEALESSVTVDEAQRPFISGCK